MSGNEIREIIFIAELSPDSHQCLREIREALD